MAVATLSLCCSAVVQKEKFATQMQIGKKDAQHFQIFQRLYNYLVATTTVVSVYFPRAT